MTQRRKILLHITIIALLLLSIGPVTARADDREFETIVSHLKARYHAKRQRIPFLGLANFALKIVHPAGVKSVKVAVFEDLHCPDDLAREELSTVIRNALSPDWLPIVRIISRRDGEQTYIYAREEGKTMRLMVVTLQATAATVAKIKLNPEATAKFVQNPQIMGISLK